MIPNPPRNCHLTHRLVGVALVFTPAATLIADETKPKSAFVLPDLVVKSNQTANTRPVTTYETPVSNLDFEPRVDLQGRNMAEAQGDVSIRGGIFENTGFRVGAATLLDPQTGHYFAEIPVAPEMLTGPVVYTGVENALYGFNSTVGTLAYGWSEIAAGGSATMGVGEHNLNFQRVHGAHTFALGESNRWQLGVEGEYSRSESDGTRQYGDHDFERIGARVQLLGPNSQTDFFAGYQDKFFGWPGMYTADVFVDFPPETEDLETRLYLINHRRDYAEDSWIELTGYYRRHNDAYTFDRFNSTSSSLHETRVGALGFTGRHGWNEAFALNYAGQATADAIESNTLETAPFLSRSYLKLSVVPEYALALGETQSLILSLGASYNDSNRDDDEIGTLGKIEWVHEPRPDHRDSLHLSYAETTQVTGYTAIAPGNPLFAGDPALGRETSTNLELGASFQRANWSLEAAVFHRRDDDLVDWTFTGGGFARSAENVDIETFGFEVVGARSWGNWEAISSYTYLHKDEDYGNPAVVGSFYALNYPEHRATFGLIWRPTADLEIRIDNEYRSQKANPLRDGPDDAVFTHLGASYYPPQIDGLEIFAALDQPWDEDFEEVPGTPGKGDLVSGGVTFRW